ncbi:MAG: hypothetical protein ACRDT2_01995 [Natronosporangium sp.]
MAFSGRALLQLAAELTNPLDLSTPTSNLSVSRQISLSEGVGLNQANKIWHDQRTLAASAAEDLDLAGILTDPWGATITFARVKLLFVAAAAGNTNNVVLGNQATNGWVGPFGANSHSLSVRPGGFVCLAAPDATGYAVVAGTGDLLRAANSGAGSSVTYDIVVIGGAT